MAVVETKRLVLRELVPADGRRMFDLYSDPQTMAFMGPPPRSVQEESENIARHAERYYRRQGYGLWAVVAKGSDEIIGRCGLLRFELRSEPQTEISYLLARQSWGNGYATEAAGGVLGFAFGTLKLDRLFALIHPGNRPSVRVAERLAFGSAGVVEYKQFGWVELYRRDRTAADA
ncbi:MAG: GCN5-related N-acetyltransferase [Phycisphaerales bacterium]|nr:GCN5-related N-acetyltransferase [Phycisphaerales bacterium]